jgi:uncharacterized membrane protein HdeD (DUF308 family)
MKIFSWESLGLGIILIVLGLGLLYILGVFTIELLATYLAVGLFVTGSIEVIKGIWDGHRKHK